MRKLPLLPFAIILYLAFNLPSHAAVIYAQNFGHASSGRITLSSLNWNALWSTSSSGNASVYNDTYYIGVSNYTGKPTNIPNVNAAPSSSNTQGVVRIFRADGRPANTLIYTDEYSIDRSSWSLESVTWYAAGTSGGQNLESLRLALKIDDVWYVSTKTHMPALTNNLDTNFSVNATQSGIYGFQSANWYTLTASAGTPFAIGSEAISLPDGDISAFGLFAEPRQVNPSYLLFDSFVIEAQAIPEPKQIVWSALLLAFALVFSSRFPCRSVS